MANKRGQPYRWRPKSKLACEVERWRVLADGCDSQIVDLPHIAPAQVALQEVLNRLLQSFTEQAVLEAQLAALFQRRRRDVQTGRDLRNRLAASLSAHFGPYGEELRQFGLKPRARRPPVRQTPEVVAAN